MKLKQLHSQCTYSKSDNDMLGEDGAWRSGEERDLAKLRIFNIRSSLVVIPCYL